MGLQTVPAYIGQAGYNHPVELFRNITEAMFKREGVINRGDMAMTPLVGSMGMSIGAGAAVLIGRENAQQGAYFTWSDATGSVAFPAAPASARIDTLLLRVKDNQYGTISGSPAAYFDVRSGTVSGSPTALPDSAFNSGGAHYVPGAWYRMADVRINSGQTQISSALVTDYTVDPPVGTVAAGFTLNSAIARYVDPGKKIVYLNLYLKSTNTITVSSVGNIADTLCYNLNSAWWPTEDMIMIQSNGGEEGDVIVQSTGAVYIRTASDDIGATSNVRISGLIVRA